MIMPGLAGSALLCFFQNFLMICEKGGGMPLYVSQAFDGIPSTHG